MPVEGAFAGNDPVGGFKLSAEVTMGHYRFYAGYDNGIHKGYGAGSQSAGCTCAGDIDITLELFIDEVGQMRKTLFKLLYHLGCCAFLGAIDFSCAVLAAERIVNVTEDFYRNKAEVFRSDYFCDFLKARTPKGDRIVLVVEELPA